MKIFKLLVLFATLFMLWVIILVLAGAPKAGHAAETESLPLSSGYMPVEAPVRPQKRITVSKGYVTNQATGQAEEIHIRTYHGSTRTITTGRISQRNIRIDLEVENPDGQ